MTVVAIIGSIITAGLFFFVAAIWMVKQREADDRKKLEYIKEEVKKAASPIQVQEASKEALTPAGKNRLINGPTRRKD